MNDLDCPFQIGDMVICINDEGYNDIGLNINERYRVLNRVNNGGVFYIFIEMANHTGFWIGTERFFKIDLTADIKFKEVLRENHRLLEI